MSERKLYGEQSLAALLGFDWSRLDSWHERRASGIWVVLPDWADSESVSPMEREVRLAHPLRDLDQPALPFPFSVEQFVAFCESAPMFAWDHIESPYSNKDESIDDAPVTIDEAALAVLENISEPAAELVRAWLVGDLKPLPPATEGHSPQPVALDVAQEHDKLPGMALSTDDICEAFADIGLSSLVWRRMLMKDRPTWLMKCYVQKGKPGATPVQPLWNVLALATALAKGQCRKAGVVPAVKLDAAFRRPLLKAASGDWAEVRANNPAWG